jgi:hypothetical protein
LESIFYGSLFVDLAPLRDWKYYGGFVFCVFVFASRELHFLRGGALDRGGYSISFCTESVTMFGLTNGKTTKII